MSESPGAQARRLMLALDAGRCAAADVALAIELAALIGAELQGLFVEDSDLLQLAQLPFAREVGERSGQDRPIVRGSMESLLKRRIERVVGELERAGKQRNVLVSHRTARGKVVRQALEQGASGDVVLLRPPAAGLGRAESRGAGRASPGPVMVWYEDGPAFAASCDVASHLARRLNAALLVGFPGGRFQSESDVLAQLAVSLAHAPVPLRLQRSADATVDSVIEAARSARAVQLVLSGRGALATTETLERIFAELAAGLVIVR